MLDCLFGYSYHVFFSSILGVDAVLLESISVQRNSLRTSLSRRVVGFFLIWFVLLPNWLRHLFIGNLRLEMSSIRFVRLDEILLLARALSQEGPYSVQDRNRGRSD